MVGRVPGGRAAVAAGIAASAGAAQLGLAYGLDVVGWRPGPDGPGSWISALTWATWVAATSTVIGAVAAARPGSRPAGERGGGVLRRLLLATAAAGGAATTVVLVGVPARLAEPAGVGSPQTVATGHAVLGVLLGLVIAVGALAARAVAANIVLTSVWLWLLAAAAVVDGVVAGREWSRVPLGFWELAGVEPWFRGVFLPDTVIALNAAFVIGVLAGLPAARRGDGPAGVVVSGAVGPLILAVAYLLSQPDLAGADPVDLSRQLMAPYLVLAGLAGSLLVCGLRPRAAPEPPVRATIPSPRSADQPATGRASA
jgi:hypothetical protein